MSGASSNGAAVAVDSNGLNVYEQQQISDLKQFIAQKQEQSPDYSAPDLLSLDRKARNKLEKTLRRELGLPKMRSTPRSTDAAAAAAVEEEEEETPEQAAARKQARKASRADKKATESQRHLRKIHALFHAGLLPAKLATQAKQLMQSGHNPFRSLEEQMRAQTGAAVPEAVSSAVLTPAELSFAKQLLTESTRAAKESESALKSSKRTSQKRKKMDERYRLPPELHIPQELILAHPALNAQRVEKEAKLFKYKRNAPNYQELVAKVRAEFIEALPVAAWGAGATSGADGNKQTAESGWDQHTKIVAEFKDVEEEKEGKLEAEEESQPQDGPARKKVKSDPSMVEVTTPAAAASTSSEDLLHRSYQPVFVSSFSWLPEQPHLRKADVDQLDARAVVEYTASRMVQPGAPYPYLKPSLPLVFHPNRKGFEVDKPGVVALIMAARVAGVTFEQQAKKEEGEGAVKQEQEEEGKKGKKEKKSKKKKKEVEDASASSSSSSSIPRSLTPAAPTSTPRLRFVSYRNNFRKFFNRKDFWRVDIQRVGDNIFLRRHLTYNYVNPFDVGHLFEQACKESSVLQGMATQEDMAAEILGRKSANKQQTRTADSTTHPYRAIVSAQLRQFDLLTSVEVDLYEKPTEEQQMMQDMFAGAAAAAVSSSSSTSASSSSLSSSSAPPSPFSPSPLSSFLELKTVKKFRWDRLKKTDVWIQTFLGGIQKTIVGYKVDYHGPDTREVKLAKRKARREAMAKGEEVQEEERRKKSKFVRQYVGKEEEAPVAIPEIIEAHTEFLLDAAQKERLMQRFYRLLEFVAKHVQEGKVYKLEHRKKAPVAAGGAGGSFVHPSRMGQQQQQPSSSSSHPSRRPFPPQSHSDNWTIVLEEIEGGEQSQPVIVRGMLKEVDRWAEGYRRGDRQRQSEGATKEQEEEEEQMSDVNGESKSKSSKKKEKSSQSKSKKKETAKEVKAEKGQKEESGSASAPMEVSEEGGEETSQSDKKEKKKGKKTSDSDSSSTQKKKSKKEGKSAEKEKEKSSSVKKEKAEKKKKTEKKKEKSSSKDKTSTKKKSSKKEKTAAMEQE